MDLFYPRRRNEITLGFFLAALTLCWSPVKTHAADKRPNVLFIAIDDLNDWLSCLGGHPQVKTPHLDRLAKRGVLFTNAHCAAPVCKSSRTAVFCGQHPFQTGVYGNKDPDIRRARPDLILLPKQLAKAGYETLGTGKLLHSNSKGMFDRDFFPEQRWSPFTKAQVNYTKEELPSKGSPHPRHVLKNGPGGRDYVFPFNGLPSDRYPDKPGGESFDWGAVDVPDHATGEGQVTDWAIDRLRERRTKPFFLAVGYYRPHIPLYAPRVDFDVYPPARDIQLPAFLKQDLKDLGPAGQRWALEAVTAGRHDTVVKSGQWREAVRAYLACVTFVDRQIGRMLAALEKTPHARNTLIIVWSDHGWHLGEKQHWGKWTGWRQSTRVPLMIIPPANKSGPRDRRCGEAVNLVDLYPTLMDYCGVQPPPGLAGHSLRPLIADPARQTGRAVITTFDPGNFAVSGRDWRYVRYREGEEELYNIRNDPNEWHNLAGDPKHRVHLERLRRQIPEAARKAVSRKPTR